MRLMVLVASLAVAGPPVGGLTASRRAPVQPSGWRVTAAAWAPEGQLQLGLVTGGQLGPATVWGAALRLQAGAPVRPRAAGGAGSAPIVRPQVGVLWARPRLGWAAGDIGGLRPAWAWGPGHGSPARPGVARGAALWWLVHPGAGRGLLAHAAVGMAPRRLGLRLRPGGDHGDLAAQGALMGRLQAGTQSLRLVAGACARRRGSGRGRRPPPATLRWHAAAAGTSTLPLGQLRWLAALRPSGPAVGLALAAPRWGSSAAYGPSARGSALRVGLRGGHPRLGVGARAALPLCGHGPPAALWLWGGSVPGRPGLRAQVRLWRRPQGRPGAAPALWLSGALWEGGRAQLGGHGALSYALPERSVRGEGRLRLRLGRAAVYLQGGAAWAPGGHARSRPAARWGAMAAIEGFVGL